MRGSDHTVTSTFEDLRSRLAKITKTDNDQKRSRELLLRILSDVYKKFRLHSVNTESFVKALEEASIKEVSVVMPGSEVEITHQLAEWKKKFIQTHVKNKEEL